MTEQYINIGIIKLKEFPEDRSDYSCSFRKGARVKDILRVIGLPVKYWWVRCIGMSTRLSPSYVLKEDCSLVVTRRIIILGD